MNRVIYYIVIGICCIIPIAFAALLGYSKVALLNQRAPTTQLKKGMNWTAQVALVVTFITIGYMVDAIVRIFRAVKSNRLLIMDESYMLLHIVFFSIYIVNLLVLDALFLKNRENTSLTPGRAFEITGFAIVLTGFFS